MLLRCMESGTPNRGSTCPWVRRIKNEMSVGTLVLQEGRQMPRSA
ncbi:Protein AMBP [Apodemus speciosus]|uniref:Protein AMBP n=1 Tax=Apodemus speciosus TaxID=105296 RepID=A0ABQ0END4_APOSI